MLSPPKQHVRTRLYRNRWKFVEFYEGMCSLSKESKSNRIKNIIYKFNRFKQPKTDISLTIHFDTVVVDSSKVKQDVNSRIDLYIGHIHTGYVWSQEIPKEIQEILVDKSLTPEEHGII